MKIGKDHLIIENACINCGNQMNGATCVGQDAPPAPGDYTVCMKCGHLMVFGEGLRFRELTGEEMHAIAGDKRLLAIMEAIGKLWKKTSNV